MMVMMIVGTPLMRVVALPKAQNVAASFNYNASITKLS